MIAAIVVMPNYPSWQPAHMNELPQSENGPSASNDRKWVVVVEQPPADYLPNCLR